MDSKDYISYYLLQDKAFRVSIPVSTLISIALLVVCELIWRESAFSFQYQLPYTKYCVEAVIIMLLTSVSGYGVGTLVTYLLFLGLMFVSGPRYYVVMLMIYSLASNYPMSKGWYKSVKMTIAAIGFFFVITCLSYLTVLWLDQKMIESLWQHGFKFIIPITFVCLVNYVYANFVPERIRRWFFSSSYLSSEVQSLRSQQKKTRTSSIGSRVTFLIALEAGFLMVCANGWGGGIFIDNIMPMDPRVSALKMSRFFMAMTISVTPIIALGVSFMNVSVVNPLILMAQAIRSSAQNGSEQALIDIHDLKIQENARVKDEIGILYEWMVKSADSTKEYIAQLERESRLANDLEVSKAANRAKSAFLSNMSHEIRTPINAVLGLDEMIIRESREPEIVQYARDIQNAGKSLLSLVNDILDFSKIEAGKLEIIPVEYDLSSVVNDLINMIEKRAEDKGLLLSVNVDETLPDMLFGDEIRIKQCALNILTNAIKYTEKGSVTLSVSGQRSAEDTLLLTIRISDTGIGIKKEDLDKLFTPFQRIEERRNRTIEGTGLGMNIVQQLLELMGSSLKVSSVYGKGSVFEFSVEQRVVSWRPIGDFNEAYRRSVRNSQAYKESFTAPDARILVTDDTSLNLTVIRGLLKRTLMQVDTAESGEETLKKICSQKYDLIFLDHRMPGMDGIETLAAMRTLEGNLNPHVPCVALTANAVSGAREMYLQAGFTDYLTKPVDSQKLEAMLAEYLPKDKVRMTAAGGAAAEKSDDESQHRLKNQLLYSVQGIDLKQALANCGGEDVLMSALREFYGSIQAKAAQIDGFASEGDLKDFTVLVHALKSSARLIGALELSERAARLEQYGDAADREKILSLTPELLSLYRGYLERLGPLFVEENKPREPMTARIYEEALSALKESVQAFDFDTADQIVSMMDEYDVPAAEKNRFEKIKQLLSAVDQGELLKLL